MQTELSSKEVRKWKRCKVRTTMSARTASESEPWVDGMDPGDAVPAGRAAGEVCARARERGGRVRRKGQIVRKLKN